ASSNGDLTLATQLISLGANINQQNISGDTPLHVAIRKKHTRLVNLLLECGADVNIRDRSGLTPLHFACVYGTYKIVEKLLNAGSYPNGISDNKYYVSTPLMIATENRKKEIAELLLERGADVDKKD
ncbi:hypothetical protein HELRODRAFT_133683, partial [Helobdella robusta]|uniref:Uncharacterized protein n=1 Tax=Helobdella robusta TaxID=6412 RepID=T1EI24_HELRO